MENVCDACRDLHSADALERAWEGGHCSSCQGLLTSESFSLRPEGFFHIALKDALSTFDDVVDCTINVSELTDVENGGHIKRLLRAAVARLVPCVATMESLLQINVSVDLPMVVAGNKRRKVAEPGVRVAVSRLSCFVRGWYNKYSRELPQTEWIVDGAPKSEASVGGVIGGALQEIFMADSAKFCAAGREDMDVRMLGGGRVFLVELLNPRRTEPRIDGNVVGPSDITTFINGKKPHDVTVHNLEVLNTFEQRNASALFKELQEKAENKNKVYGCVCRSATPVTDIHSRLQALVGVVQQRTPVRVAHRRAMCTRPREVFAVKAAPVDEHFFCLYVEAQAGGTTEVSDMQAPT